MSLERDSRMNTECKNGYQKVKQKEDLESGKEKERKSFSLISQIRIPCSKKRLSYLKPCDIGFSKFFSSILPIDK